MKKKFHSLRDLFSNFHTKNQSPKFENNELNGVAIIKTYITNIGLHTVDFKYTGT